MPDLTQEQQIKESTGQAGEAPKVTPDEYIGQRHEQKREKRGGVQVRIDKLTKEAAENKRLAEEMKQKLTAIEQKQVVPVTPSPAPPAADKPDPRPKREDFPDEGEFTTKIAEWVVRQQNKIVAAAPAAAASPTPEVKEVTFDPANPEHVRIKGEFDREFPAFQQAGQEFIKNHSDFDERLNAASAKGLTLDMMAQRAIIKLKSPQVLYYLADPANETQARALMTMDAVNQVIQIGLIHDKLQAKGEVKPTDFISNAPKPGTHLTNGSTRATIPRGEMDPDDYIALRREEKRSKLRH